jgi:hypothetical protein
VAERKHKRGSRDIAELDEDASILVEPTQVELGLGYTLAVRYDENERPVVDVKTYGHVNMEQLRREIEGAFPNARIRQNEQPQRVVVAKKNRERLGAAKKKSR